MPVPLWVHKAEASQPPLQILVTGDGKRGRDLGAPLLLPEPSEGTRQAGSKPPWAAVAKACLTPKPAVSQPSSERTGPAVSQVS